MKVKVNKDRFMEIDNIIGSQYENLATTLEFEFPEYIEKNEMKIPTSEFNKYIVFDIDEPENQALIIADKYSIPYEITKLGEVTFYVKLEEKSESENVSDKLIWISRGKDIYFNKTEEGKTIITTEKIDAFNQAITELNEKTDEVQELINDIENKIETDEFKGDKGDRGAAGTVIQSIEPEEEETVIWVDEEDESGVIIDKEEIEAEIKEEINPILNKAIETSERAEAIAKGRATGYVFDTIVDLDEWLQDNENTSKLVLGDNLYIREVGVPDYWWDGTSKQILETQKVDLDEYAKKDEIKALTQEVYSTNETIIGKWIDEKTIYRKVIRITSIPTNEERIKAGITSFNELITLKCLVRDSSDNSWREIPWTVGHSGSVFISNWNAGITYSSKDDVIIIQCGTDFKRTNLGHITLEYTKTID